MSSSSSSSVRGKAIVIDNGSSHVRVGWAGLSQPTLIFPNATTKPKSKQAPQFEVGEHVSSGTRPVIEDGIIVHWDSEEAVLDHAFSKLSIRGSSVDHPIVMTEAVCNPNHCRARMSELLVEAYGVPSVTYGVDGLFSYYHNTKGKPTNALIVSTSSFATHVLPYIDQRLDARHAKRLDVGGQHLLAYLGHILDWHYPELKPAISEEQVEQIFKSYSYVPTDYAEELRQFEDIDFRDAHSRVHQLPVETSAVPTDEELAEREIKRKARADRMIEMMNKRNAEKMAKLASNLESLWAAIIAISDADDGEEVTSLLQTCSCGSLEELGQKFQKGLFKLNTYRAKHAEEEDDTAMASSSITVPDEWQLDESRTFPLADTESTKGLSQEQKRQKRMEETQKTIHVARVKTQKMAAAEQEKTAQKRKRSKSDGGQEAESKLHALQMERDDLLQRVEDRKRRKQELSDRRSTASKQRMRLLVQQAQMSPTKGSGNEDTFGADDSDWQVYMEINRHDEEEDDDESRLSQLDAMIERYELEQKQRAGIRPTRQSLIEQMEQEHQLRLDVARIRVPEALFEPRMTGVDQCGVSELLAMSFRRYEPPMQLELAQNVFLTGAVTQLPGYQQRIEAEVRSMRPFQSPIRIWSAADPEMDAWRGAAKWASEKEQLRRASITRDQLLECGWDYLTEHLASNIYIQQIKAKK